MNKKQLAVKLSKLKDFVETKVILEQYQLNSEIAAKILWWAYLNGNIKGKTIADFGCGNGVLGIGTLLLNAKRVYFVDVDKEAIRLAEENLNALGFDKKAECMNINVSEFKERVDTVIQNPPFGTKVKHSDKIFLEKAMQFASSIYSLHKITSREFIRVLTKDNGWKVRDILEISLPLRKSLHFHRKKVRVVETGCWRLVKG